jgi:hypothetical protein
MSGWDTWSLSQASQACFQPIPQTSINTMSGEMDGLSASALADLSGTTAQEVQRLPTSAF